MILGTNFRISRGKKELISGGDREFFAQLLDNIFKLETFASCLIMTLQYLPQEHCRFRNNGTQGQITVKSSNRIQTPRLLDFMLHYKLFYTTLNTIKLITGSVLVVLFCKTCINKEK